MVLNTLIFGNTPGRNRRMCRLAIVLICVGGLFGPFISAVRAEITAEQVREAIQRGVGYLKNQQRADGSWPDVLGMPPGGVDALCTLALLNAGVEPDEEPIERALNNLRKIKPVRTYVVALQTMVFARASPQRDKLLIARNVKWLEGVQISDGDYKGAWSYPGVVGGGVGDNSNTQFALLALYEAERAGVPASERTWLLAKQYWEKCQRPDGSWGYNLSESGGRGSMTCAGITSLVIASGRLNADDARVEGNAVRCCQPRDKDDADRIQRGMEWLGRHYSVSGNPGASGGTWQLYYLYGLERVGRLTAQRFIPLPARQGQPAKADWYREGAEHLVRTQDGLSGYWVGAGNAENNPTIGTSLALLFLSKGRWPVLLAKLQHRDDGDWNAHRADVANLTRYVESRWKRDLTWQVVDPRAATVEDLLQTPVVYLSGSRSPLPDNAAQQKALAEKLRDYLDRGGFLLAEANCGGGEFDRGFRALMELAYPEPEYRLRLLEPEHPVWYAEEKVAADQLRPLLGIEAGCRTSVIYAPPDPPDNPRPSLGCLWELAYLQRGGPKFAAGVQAQIDAALSLGVNILAYATNRELKDKLDRPAGAAKHHVDQAERGVIEVATLKHPGGCNVAPRAVPNLMDAAAEELKIRARVREQPLAIDDEALFQYHLAFMHGRTTFRLTDAERKQLRQFIERGGMLMADAICGSRAFGESFRREMALVLPDNKLERIPADDPLLSPTYGGFDLKTVGRRDPSAAAPGKPLDAAVRKVPPDLEGIKIGDRWGVVFSRYDLSCALERHDSPACQGYTRQDAARIGLNVLLYSLQH
jgi:hypothetical protein